MVDSEIHESWKGILLNELHKEYFSTLKKFVAEETEKYTIYTSGKNIFAAFNFTPFDKVKVVILGQDPYHGPGQANGLCFSVSDGIRSPPSLKNIFKELQSDIGCEIPLSGNLEPWAKQGVFLLNATLTVRGNAAGSHQNKGWEYFTDSVIKTISDKKEKVVFMLWGNYAKAKAGLIDHAKHLVLEAAHPSPLARGAYFGSKHFSKANEYLKKNSVDPVDWCL